MSTHDVWQQQIMQAARRYFRALPVDMPAVEVAHSDEVRTGFEMHLVRENGKVRALYSLDAAQRRANAVRRMGQAYWLWFAQAPDIRHITCDLSDGQWPGMARFTPSGCLPHKIPVPDTHFFRDEGYAETDRVAADAPAWDDRSDEIVWRGYPNGVGLFTADASMADVPGVRQRCRMALHCRPLGVDFRFVEGPLTPDILALEAPELIGDRIPTQSWAGRKFAIDIDGVTNAWENLLMRLKQGCCVLKVASPFGFRQWYYDALTPWEHYVPVAADLSDLAEKVAWLRDTPREARAIAAEGQAFARAMTFRTETARAGRLIETYAEG